MTEKKLISMEDLRKMQLLELKILKEVKRICEKNSIPYFLIAGTLLGAVRHKGFIPWDDDIDIGMLRDDYERFLEVCKTDLDSEYFLQTPTTEKGNADYGIAHVRLNGTEMVQEFRKNTATHNGLTIDIFPYDTLPENKFFRFFYCKSFPLLKRVCAKRMGYAPHPPKLMHRIILNMLYIFSLPIPLSFLHKKMTNYHIKQNKKKTDYVIPLSEWNYKREKHLYSTLTELTTLQFEDEFFPVPKNYDLFLTEQYGNYRELPKDIESCYNRHRCISLDFGEYK
ncbi:MAG: LicD family protein [Spirochaetaceae bacterium]|nr:LicD family protein [Spirochaetaceae bacterium]